MDMCTQGNTTPLKKNEIMPFAARWGGIRDPHPERSKAERERQIPFDINFIWNLIYGKKSWTWGTDLWLPSGKVRV